MSLVCFCEEAELCKHFYTPCWENNKGFENKQNQRTIGPENAHLKPDLGVLSHHKMTLTLNTHTPLST